MDQGSSHPTGVQAVCKQKRPIRQSVSEASSDERIIIEAVLEIGAGFVSGSFTPFHYRLSERTIQ